MQEELELMLAVLHGRWTSDRIRHDCIGRGCKRRGSQAACKALIAELMVWLSVEPMPGSPHFSRWIVLGPRAAWFAMTCLPHNIFKQAWMLATKNEKPANTVKDPDAPGSVDFATVLGRRVTRVP